MRASPNSEQDKNMKDKVVIGVAGMPGAGKSILEEAAQKMGYAIVAMGDEIREEAKKRKLEPTPENLGKIMLMLRKEEGSVVVARRCIPKVKNAKENVVVIDGIRSLEEANEFRRHFPNFTLVAIHASPETRFQRLFQRKRSDDPEGWETFMERDLRELSVGLGDAIATADYMIVNERTKDQLKKKVREVLKSVAGNE